MSSKLRNRSTNTGSSYLAFKNSMASMDAAALQSDMASRYNLPGSHLTIKVLFIVIMMKI